MVPDVSGIDRVFDYSVPGHLEALLRPGVRVRIPLNGRRVSGWVVAVGEGAGIDPSRLVDVVSVSGQSVEEDVVPLTKWVAETFWGPWRAVLTSASAPRVRRRGAVPARTSRRSVDVAADGGVLGPLLDDRGGLVVIPPLESVVNLLLEAARRGPVLVVCPTLRMARLGAAALRRHGLSTAEVPDEWERAVAGVDVVIGARTAVFAPCPGANTIVVVDEHDESLQEERSPTWHARSVARERAHRTGVPILCTSSVPSAESAHAFGDRTVRVGSSRPWPRIVAEDLEDLPVRGSMLGTRMLEAIGSPERTTLCILNTKGNARLLRCRSCALLQSCGTCGSALGDDGSGILRCTRCAVDVGSVCGSCGRTGFRVIAAGTQGLANDIRRSTGRAVVEVTAETDAWDSASVFVGTDALLNRVPRADTVVFCDVDRDVLAPTLSAPREFLARMVKAARLVGVRGTIVLQTRMTGHPLIGALVSDDVDERLSIFLGSDLAMRSSLGLPPFSRVVRVSGASATVAEDVHPGVQIVTVGEDLLLRGTDDADISACLGALRERGDGLVRVYADPYRF